jgi:AcrR family transcriptional regulator
MPRIEAPTVAEHRERRRDALVTVAAEVMREQGATGVTMASVAQRAGISRSAVYEYYSSAADLIADVIVDELAEWADHLQQSTQACSDPHERIEAWVRAGLEYITDGRHGLVRAAGEATLPPVRKAQVAAMHRDLAAPIVTALQELQVAGAHRYASYAWGVMEAASRHIESGRSANDEVDAAVAFILAGIDLAR